MFRTSVIVAAALLCGLSIFADSAQAIPECEGIDKSSVTEVVQCLNAIPQFETMLPQVSGSAVGCQFAKLTFRSGSGTPQQSPPTCDVFARAIIALNYPEPPWSACAKHFDLGESAAPCLQILLEDLAVNRGIQPDCSRAQTLMRSIGFSMLEAADAANYQVPSCAQIESALAAVPADSSEPRPAQESARVASRAPAPPQPPVATTLAIEPASVIESTSATADLPELDNATPFRLYTGIQSTSRNLWLRVSSGRLSVDTEAKTAVAFLSDDNSPITLEGTYLPFELADPGQGQRASYAIHGEWHGQGDQWSKCHQARNGHDYWGSFTLTVDRPSLLRVQSCPETADENNYIRIEFRINWGGILDFETENEMLARFDPPAGSFVRGDPELVAARQAAARAEQIEAERLRIKPGLVYKPSTYWSDAMGAYDTEREIAATLKNIFDGVYDDIDYTEPHLRLIYYHYVLAYSDHCRRTIENDPNAAAVSMLYVTLETDQFGQIDRDEGTPFLVEGRFVERFDEYDGWISRWLASVMMSAAASGNIIEQGMSAATTHANVMNRVVPQLRCDSATMRQFKENLWRATHNEPSLQQSGGEISGAELETELPDYLR